MREHPQPPPPPPESRFVIHGVSPWPFDNRRTTGPWSEREMDNVYGNTPRWAKRLLRMLGLRPA